MIDMIREIAERLRGMRDVLAISEEEMAVVTDLSVEEYRVYESGDRDFPFTFLYKAAHHFGIDLTELTTGESPHLTGYTIVRSGQGMPIRRRQGFEYLNVASRFRGRIAEPFIVTAPYVEGAETAELIMNRHEGQEMDYILSGTLRMKIGEHEEVLNEGDTIYYDSGLPHGMVAIDGEPCRLLAVVISHS